MSGCLTLEVLLCLEHSNQKMGTNKQKAGVSILISENIDFKANAILREQEGYYIVIKRSIQQNDITLVHIYAANIGSPKYIKL